MNRSNNYPNFSKTNSNFTPKSKLLYQGYKTEIHPIKNNAISFVNKKNYYFIN